VLEGILKLLHPLMPHITEEIWHTLTQKSDEALALQSYPEVGDIEGTNWSQPVSLETETRSPLPAPTTETPKTELKPIASASDSGALSRLNPSLSQSPSISNQVAKVLSELPDQIGQFFNQYQRPMIVVALLLVTIITLKVALATVSAINSFPILQPTFEVVGIGYTMWFAWRYLLTVAKRQELGAATVALKEQVIGTGEPKPLPRLAQEDTRSSPALISGSTSLIDPQLEQQFELLIGTIRTIRNLRAEAEIKPGVKVTAILQSSSPEERQILETGQSYIKDLAKVESLTITPALEQELKTTMAGVVGTVQVLMPLEGVVDFDALRAKLERDLGKVEAEAKSLSGRLANQNFVSKAPADIVQGAKEALAEAEKQAEILRDRLSQI
jgi:valyl-tRNA synthetase